MFSTAIDMPIATHTFSRSLSCSPLIQVGSVVPSISAATAAVNSVSAIRVATAPFDRFELGAGEGCRAGRVQADGSQVGPLDRPQRK
jgi:hypothetical protein